MMRMFGDRNPSPPPTLIRRYSSISASGFSEPSTAAMMVTIDNERDKHAHQEKLTALKKMSETKPSSYRGGVSYQRMVRDELKAETRHAFKCSKLYKLRKSPAYIVWPDRPAPSDVESTDIDSLSGTECSNAETSRRPSKKDGNVKSWSRLSSSEQERKSISDNEKGLTGTRTSRKLKDDDEELVVKKSDSNTSFWENAVGSIRVDSLFIGSPRRDPYNSTWTRDQRRCFFMSDWAPHHTRGVHPVPVMPAVDRKDKDPAQTGGASSGANLGSIGGGGGLRWHVEKDPSRWRRPRLSREIDTEYSFKINDW